MYMIIIIEKDLYAKFFLGFLDLCFFPDLNNIPTLSLFMEPA